MEEEVFENERYQPFRGWGHQWPGHFLPTDRVGHWSAGSLPQSPTLDHTCFNAVAPRLKKVGCCTLLVTRSLFCGGVLSLVAVLNNLLGNCFHCPEL